MTYREGKSLFLLYVARKMGSLASKLAPISFHPYFQLLRRKKERSQDTQLSIYGGYSNQCHHCVFDPDVVTHDHI